MRNLEAKCLFRAVYDPGEEGVTEPDDAPERRRVELAKGREAVRKHMWAEPRISAEGRQGSSGAVGRGARGREQGEGADVPDASDGGSGIVLLSRA